MVAWYKLNSGLSQAVFGEDHDDNRRSRCTQRYTSVRNTLLRKEGAARRARSRWWKTRVRLWDSAPSRNHSFREGDWVHLAGNKAAFAWISGADISLGAVEEKAVGKINELERTLAKVQVMKEMLEAVMSCRCQDLAQCARSLGSRPAQSQTAQERPSRQL